MLWIAFKIVFLCEDLQDDIEGLDIYRVVNCFQNSIFVWGLTRPNDTMWLERRLWIAFKIVFLCEDLQDNRNNQIDMKSCELLSK